MFDLYAGVDFYEINVSFQINDKLDGADIAYLTPGSLTPNSPILFLTFPL
jgi:hypothetical protein